MFRDNKTAFGQTGATTFGFGAGATPGVTPFGATSMANAAGATAFGKPATAPGQPVFGSGATTSLFGSAATGAPGNAAVPQGGSLFGGASAGATFGMGHQTQQAFGGFSSATTTPNIFGAAPGTAGTGATAGGGLFGVASTSTAPVGAQQVSTSNAVPFGSAPKQASAFGTLGGFGQPATAPQQAGGGLFGSTSGGMFSTGFGSTPGAATGAGTPVKFSPLMGTDSMVKNGAQQTINTRHQCITCMKEYESKSLEELRMEDYAAGRRGGGVAGGVGGPTNSVVTPGFGPASGVFGSGTTGTSTGSLFGKPVTGTTPVGGFPVVTTSANSGFSFSVPGSTLFGAPNANKPFGAAAPQPSTLFGTGSTANAFGGQSMGFSAFGQQNQSIGLFGQAKSPFATTGTPGLGFGAGTTVQNANAAAQPAQGTSLFGTPKPATAPNAFGTPNAFGVATSTAPPAFGSAFGSAGTSTTPGASVFGQPFKPATTGAFTFGQTTQANTGLGAGLNLGQPSLFGNTGTKPGGTGVGGGLGSGGGLFGGGTTGTSGGGLFGGTANTGAGLGSGTTTFGSGNTTMGLGTGGSSLFGGGGTIGGGLGTTLGGGTQLGQGMLGTNANTGLLGSGSGNLGGTSNPAQWGTGQSSGLGLSLGNQMSGGLLGSSMNPSFLGGTQFSSGGLGGTGSIGIGSVGGSTVVPSAGSSGGAQHVMSVSSLPFGDSRLFRDLLPSSAKLEEVLKTTNPAAQKALMAGNQFKVSPHSGNTGKVKVKPLGASALSKRSLFDGLEEEDASLLTVFSPRTGSKRLTLKPKPPGTSNLGESSLSTSINSISTPGEASVNGPRLSLRARLAASSSSQWEKDSSGPSSEAGSQWLRKPSSSLKRDSSLGKGTISSGLQNSNHESAHAINDSSSDLENTIPYPRTPLDSSGGTPIGRSPPHRKKDLDYPSGSRDRSRLDGSEDEVDGEVSSNVELVGEGGGSGSIIRETLLGAAETLRSQRVEESEGGRVEEEAEGGREPHATGITLRRSGYYTIPSMDELATMVEQVEDGEGSKTVSVVVENFTVGREGYGNVFFFDSFDVAGLNLDEIVHFRHKEIVVYPGDGDDEEEEDGGEPSSTNQSAAREKKVDGSNKPIVGHGLNRRAQVTLDRVWPIDKVTRSPVMDPDRLTAMEYEGKLRRVCAQMRTRFVEYRPQTGSWVFKVDHFSKYGLSDSDEDDCQPFPPLSAAPGAAATTATSNATAPGPNQVVANGAVSKKMKRLPLQPRDSRMHGNTVVDQIDQSMAEDASMDLSKTDGWPVDGSHSSRGKRTQALSSECQNGFHENGINAAVALSPTAQIAQQLGTSTHKVQLMKASFFGDEGEEIDGQFLDQRPLDQLIKPQQGMFLQEKKGMQEGEELRSTPVADLFRTQFSCRDPTLFNQIKSKRGLGGDSDHHPSVRPHGGRPPSTLSSSSTSQFLLPIHETSPPLLQPVSIPLASKGSSTSSRPSVLPPHPLIHRAKMAVLKHRGRHMKHAELVQRILPNVESQSLLLADLRLFSGRAFRSGWGPGMKLSVLTSARVAAESMSKPQELFSRLIPLSNGRCSSDSSGLVMQQLQLLGGTTDTAVLQGWIEPHLWVQLQHSDVAYDDEVCEHAKGKALDEEPGLGGPCPRFSPQSGQEIIHAHCDLYHCGDEDATKTEDPELQISSFSRLVWDLCCALWGQLPELEDGSSEEVYLSSHKVSMARRKALSDWLQQAANEGIRDRGKKGALRSHGNDDAHTEAVFNLLTRRRLLEACEASQRKGDHFVALMLAGGGWEGRVQLRKQLSAWSRVGADEFISEGRMKLMALKAGAPLLPTNSIRHSVVDCCWGLDWKRAFAMHLWYVYSPVCSITDALLEYESAFSSDPKASDDFEGNEGGSLTGKSYAPAPVPHYMEARHIRHQMELGSGEKPPYYDLCFHLLKLYSCRSHSLEALLNTSTHTPDPLDVRLSWLLCGALNALGYSHLAAESESSLHQSMAALLEAHGMWHWALFPLLHLKNPKRRKASVMDVLGRHVRISGVDSESDKEYDQREQFVITGLHVPSAWVYNAKAKLAASLHRYGDAAWCLAKAGLWNECHVIILKHIAADAIINENLDFLRDLLAQLAPEERSHSISGWSCGGQVFWDYLEVLSEIETLMKRGSKEVHGGMDVCVNENYCMERLQPKLSSLCSRLIALPCKTAKERLCRSEISKRIAHVVRALVLMMGGVDSSGTSLQASRVLAYLVTQLPMPPDYLIQELRHLVEVHLDRVTAKEDE